MGSDLGVEYAVAIGFEALQRSRLVGLHETTVADHVRAKDRAQFAVHQGVAMGEAESRQNRIGDEPWSANKIITLRRGRLTTELWEGLGESRGDSTAASERRLWPLRVEAVWKVKST
jgi:hypothetical protein